MVINMDVIIYPDETGIVKVLSIDPRSGIDLQTAAATLLTPDTVFEIVDHDSLPWDQPRDAWEWG